MCTPVPETLRAPCSDKPSTCGKDKHSHCPPKVDEDEDFTPKSQPPPSKGKGKQREERPPSPPPPHTPTPPPQSPTPPSESESKSEEEQGEEEGEKEEEPGLSRLPIAGPSLRRSSRQPKPRFDKDSIYGKKTRARVDKMSK